MKEFKTRHKIMVGSRVKVRGEIKTGVDQNGVPYWKFPVALTEIRGGESVVYDWVWLKCIGKCEFEVGQWLEVTSINGYAAGTRKNTVGGISIFRTLECNFKKVEKEL